MYNLIQIQDAIKTVPLKDVMDYANGKNPQVPSYLALAELNRRKQIQETESAFYGEPQDLKTQIESSLTQAPAGVDVTQAPPGQIDVTKLPPQFAPNLPPVGQVQPGAAPQGQVNPTQAPPIQAARGGLMSSPDIARGLASMPISQFKQSNFANGGIVAFADTPAPGMTVGQAAERTPTEEEVKAAYEKWMSSKGPWYLPKPKADLGEKQAESEYTRLMQAYQSGTPITGLSTKEIPVEKQASATTSGQIEKPTAPTVTPPAARPSGIQTVAPQRPAAPSVPVAAPKTMEERLGSALPTEEEQNRAIAFQEAMQKRYGVSQDPYAEVKKRYEKIEAEREERRKEEPMKELMEWFRAYGSAPAHQGWWGGLREASKASTALEKQHVELREKQDLEMAKLYEAMAKEEDARKRGNMKLAEGYMAQQQAHKAKIIDLEQKQEKLGIESLQAQSMYQQSIRPHAIPPEIQIVDRIAKEKGISFTDAYEYLQSAKGLEAAKRQYDKDWDERMSLRLEWEKKGGYPAYMASKGIAVPGAAPQGGAGNLPPKVVKDGKTYILNPQTGKYREQ